MLADHQSKLNGDLATKIEDAVIGAVEASCGSQINAVKVIHSNFVAETSQQDQVFDAIINRVFL